MKRNGDNEIYYKERLLQYTELLLKTKLEKSGQLTDSTSKTYVIYVRRSTKGKKKQERSIPDQIKECQKLAKDKHLKVVQIFQEKESAKRAGIRDVFYQMIDGIRKKRFNAIIAWHPDRLARNMKDAGEIIDLLDRNAIVDLQFPTYTFTKDANGMMALGIQFVMAKQYSDALSVSSQRGTRRKAQEGKAPIRTKYGYILDKHNYFRPDKHSFPLLQKAFYMALEKEPLYSISDYLNNAKFQYNGHITKITKQKLSATFADPFYAGVFMYGDQIVDLQKQDALFVPMITPLQFLELRNIFDNKKNFKLRAKAEILLRKMVYCSYCKNLMIPSKPQSSGKSRHRYLRIVCTNRECYRYKHRGIRRDIRAKVIFDYIIQVLEHNTQIDRKTYQAYTDDAKNYLKTDRNDYHIQLLNTKRQISEIKKELNEKYKAIAVIKDVRVIDELNREISKLTDDQGVLEERKSQIENIMVDLDHGIQSDLLPYEKFLNFFKNLAGIVKNHSNKLLVDRVIRMVFLNFDVDEEKVLLHRPNPAFERFLKPSSVLPSRGGET